MAGTKTLNFAIVGCGQMGRLHSERLRADGRGRVVAVFDAVPSAAERLQRELAPEAAVCLEFDALLEREGIDAAVVCTPTTSHFEQVCGCRSRGWNVLCEKPLCDTRERIVALIGDAQAGPVLSVAYQRRSWGTYRKLRDLVRSQQYGRIRAVTSTNTERWQQTISGTWRDDPAINAGGFIADAGSHKIDALFFVTGLTPHDVFAANDNCGSRVEIVSSVCARLEGGRVPLSMSFAGNAESFVEDLHIHCEGESFLLRDRKLWMAGNNAVRELAVEGDTNPVSSFLDFLLAGGENVAPAECALPVFDLTQAILESGRSGQPVPVGRPAPGTGVAP